ncbi:Stealth CR1 domain-containing protein [Bacteroidales bacterium OttesenSCG-928-A17]|nr:Stealth CR1 domain-containing protein [Bacteroidales bacterium OttesenSCG-928-A17]
MKNGENNPIDAVITWVDGDDPAHQEKMRPYLNAVDAGLDDVAGSTRFKSIKEIYFCVASIYRFAPFIRKIFIVTDNQNPELEPFLKENFPEGPNIPIEIVDHTTIFKGYEQHLPLFSSRAIESGLYRIPGLSENYIYFNDDVMLSGPFEPEDWFVDDKVVIRGHIRNMILDKFISSLKPRKNGHKPIGFKDGMRKSAELVGSKYQYFYNSHTPHPAKKSALEQFHKEHPGKLAKNISYRFRHADQYNPQALFYMYMLKEKRNQLIIKNEKELYIKPVNRGELYVKRKIRDFDRKHPRLICVQSLDQATETDRQTILNWLGSILNIRVD